MIDFCALDWTGYLGYCSSPLHLHGTVRGLLWGWIHSRGEIAGRGCASRGDGGQSTGCSRIAWSSEKKVVLQSRLLRQTIVARKKYHVSYLVNVKISV